MKYKNVQTSREREAQKLRRYDENQLLEMISAFSLMRRDKSSFESLLRKYGASPQAKLRDCQLAFVTKLVLHFWGKPRLSQRNLKTEDLIDASDSLIRNQGTSSYPLTTIEDIDKNFLRMAYQQFPDFYGDRETFARTQLLFRTCTKEVENEMGFNVDDAFQEATGLTLDKCWDITLAICGLLLM